MSNLKNYTSSVPASTSIGRIEEMLVAVGAKNINKQYEDGSLKSFTFLIDITLPSGVSTQAFRIPAKVDVVYKILIEKYKRNPTPTQKEQTKKQSERTAWKIVCDWVEIQCTMIQMEQVEVAQVFLPYHYDHETDTTLWERIHSGSTKLLQ